MSIPRITCSGCDQLQAYCACKKAVRNEKERIPGGSVWLGPDWDGVEKEFTVTASGAEWVWLDAEGYDIDVRYRRDLFDEKFKRKTIIGAVSK